MKIARFLFIVANVAVAEEQMHAAGLQVGVDVEIEQVDEDGFHTPQRLGAARRKVDTNILQVLEQLQVTAVNQQAALANAQEHILSTNELLWKTCDMLAEFRKEFQAFAAAKQSPAVDAVTTPMQVVTPPPPPPTSPDLPAPSVPAPVTAEPPAKKPESRQDCPHCSVA